MSALTNLIAMMDGDGVEDAYTAVHEAMEGIDLSGLTPEELALLQSRFCGRAGAWKALCDIVGDQLIAVADPG